MNRVDRILIIIGTIACVIAMWVLTETKFDSRWHYNYVNKKVHNVLKKRFNDKDVVVTGRKYRTISHLSHHFTMDWQYDGDSYDRYSNEPTESAYSEAFLLAMRNTGKSDFSNYKVSLSNGHLDSLVSSTQRPLYGFHNYPWEINVYYIHQPENSVADIRFASEQITANQWDEFTIVPCFVGFSDTTYTSYYVEHPDHRWIWINMNDSLKSQLQIHVYEALDSAYNYLTTNKESPFAEFFDDSFPYKETYEKYNNKQCGRENKLSEDGISYWCYYDSAAYGVYQWFYSNRIYGGTPVNSNGMYLNQKLSRYGEGAPTIGYWNNGDFIVFFTCVPHVKATKAEHDTTTPTAIAILGSIFLLLLTCELLAQGRLFNRHIKVTGRWMTYDRWISGYGFLFVVLLLFNLPTSRQSEETSFPVPPLSESKVDNDVFFFQMVPDATDNTPRYEQTVGLPEEYLNNPSYIYSILASDKKN